MRKMRHLLFFYFVTLFCAFILLNNCDKDNGTNPPEVTYSTADLQGIWNSQMTYTATALDTTLTGTVEFGPGGTLVAMDPSPNYESIEDSLTVDEEGNISGSITTTHKTHNGQNTETTVMNWTGSTFVSKTKISLDMNWTWQNTSGGSGTFTVTGELSKQ